MLGPTDVMVLNVTGRNYDIMVLKLLDDYRKLYTDIRETAYLKDFAELKTFDNTLNPKYIIRDTLITYIRSVCDIYKQPHLLQTYYFLYTSFEDDKTYLFEYSNNMYFSEDITTLCFLHHILNNCQSDECEVVQVLMSLMKNKYGIDIEREMRENNIESIREKNRITLFDIAFSYPSVSCDMCINMGIYDTWFDKFSKFNLPKRIFLSLIIPVLPMLKQNPPFAILLLTALRLLEEKGKDIKSISLRTIFSQIYVSYRRLIFPQDLTLELCMKWKIVVKKKSVYKYSDCFEAYRREAKAIIAEIKSDSADRDLKSILRRL